MHSIEALRKNLAQLPPFQGVGGRFAGLIGGHGQTLLGHFLPTRPIDRVETERVEMTTPDGDTLVGFLARPSKTPEVGLLHIFHGLSGSSDSFYMPRAGHAALSLGYATILWNHRGCGAGRKLALEPYHSGRSDDLARAVAWGRKRFSAEGFHHGVLGYSLSANAACLLAARVVPSIDSSPLGKRYFESTLGGSLPDFVIAINPPFDLKKASERLSQGASRIYGQSFMPSLLECLEDRVAWKAESESRETYRMLAERARRTLSVFTDVGTFDAAYTGPAGGFRDHLDYYARASCGPYLENALVPLVVLSASDDPITHGFSDLDSSKLAEFKNPLVLIDAQERGGHMGYVDSATLISPFKKTSRWLEDRIRLYLDFLGNDS